METEKQIAPPATETQNKLTEMYGLFGEAKYYCDTDYQPRLQRKEIERIFAELKQLADATLKPLSKLTSIEIKHDVWFPQQKEQGANNTKNPTDGRNPSPNRNTDKDSLVPTDGT